MIALVWSFKMHHFVFRPDWISAIWQCTFAKTVLGNATHRAIGEAVSQSSARLTNARASPSTVSPQPLSHSPSAQCDRLRSISTEQQASSSRQDSLESVNCSRLSSTHRIGKASAISSIASRAYPFVHRLEPVFVWHCYSSRAAARPVITD